MQFAWSQHDYKVTFGKVHRQRWFKTAKFVSACFTACALQQEFEPNEMRLLWRKPNSEPYVKFLQQPVLTRWENVSLACKNYLSKRLGFVKFCKCMCNMHKTDHNKNKIASDHLSLAKEEASITMCYFLSACCGYYWDK